MRARMNAIPLALGLGLVGLLSLGFGSCGAFGLGSLFLRFEAPLFAQVSLTEGVGMRLGASRLIARDSLRIELDGAPLPDANLVSSPDGMSGVLPPLDPGRHVLRARAELRVLFFLRIPLVAATAFAERGCRVLRLSGATGEGVERLVSAMAEGVDTARREEAARAAGDRGEGAPAEEGAKAP